MKPIADPNPLHFRARILRFAHHEKNMAKDKEPKKDKKSKKIKSSELTEALADPANTSTDIILTATPKKEDAAEIDDEDFYESKLSSQAAFAKPLASKKLNKKVLKTVKKGTEIANRR
jgi:hypothetical protein